MRSNVIRQVYMSIRLHIFLLAQRFYQVATTTIKAYIRPAWVGAVATAGEPGEILLFFVR